MNARKATPEETPMATANDPSAPEFWDIRFREGRMPWDAGGVPKELEAYLLEAPARMLRSAAQFLCSPEGSAGSSGDD